MGAAPVVLDVDTGIDDALAILYAASEPQLDLVGVSAVVGNVPVAVAAHNSALVLAAAGRSDVPVAVGSAVTSEGRTARTGPTNHGVDGLGGVVLRRTPAELSALTPAELVDRSTRDGPVTLAACAPLTNAAALVERPGLGGMVIVGGELVVDEGEPEFNVAHDPSAAARVLASSVPTTVYPIDVFETVSVPPSLVRSLENATSPAARLASELLAVRRAHLLGDAGAVVLLAHPELFSVERMRMGVVGDRLVPCDDGHEVDVVVDADGPAVVEAFEAALRAGAAGPG